MIHHISEDRIRRLVVRFLEHAQRRIEAVRSLDTPAANRSFLNRVAASDQLVASEEGRRELERLLMHPELHIRVTAACLVLDWAAEKAIPILGSVLDADLSDIPSVDECLDIRLSAKDMLFVHFGIRPGDRNDLIEPLRKYGIELRRRHRPD